MEPAVGALRLLALPTFPVVVVDPFIIVGPVLPSVVVLPFIGAPVEVLPPPGESVSRDENVLSFAPSSAPDCGTTALNLVYQAAEVFSSMEDRARETEARAQSLCKSAVERLKLAGKRIETAERERANLPLLAHVCSTQRRGSTVLDETPRWLLGLRSSPGRRQAGDPTRAQRAMYAHPKPSVCVRFGDTSRP
jgi:hypothetical protein